MESIPDTYWNAIVEHSYSKSTVSLDAKHAGKGVHDGSFSYDPKSYES